MSYIAIGGDINGWFGCCWPIGWVRLVIFSSLVFLTQGIGWIPTPYFRWDPSLPVSPSLLWEPYSNCATRLRSDRVPEGIYFTESLIHIFELKVRCFTTLCFYQTIPRSVYFFFLQTLERLSPDKKVFHSFFLHNRVFYVPKCFKDIQ